MAKSKYFYSTISELEKRREDWIESRVMNFRPGDIVKGKLNADSIGVIYYGLTEPETYRVKWYVGPKPWNFIEGSAHGSAIEKAPEGTPNPLKYKWTELVPGPGSDMIAALQEKFAEQDRQKLKNRTAKEVEEHLAAIEEDLKNKKQLIELDETKVDLIVDETAEDDEVSIPTNDIDVKRDRILSEE